MTKNYTTKNLYESLEAELSTLMRAYQTALSSPPHYNAGYWRILTPYDGIKARLDTAVNRFFLWGELVEKATELEKKGVRAWYHLSKEPLVTPTFAYQQFVNELDMVEAVAYNPNTKQDGDVSIQVRLGALLGSQSLLTSTDRFHTFLHSLEKDKAFNDALLGVIEVFEKAKLTPAPTPQTVERFSANVVLSMTSDGLDEFIAPLTANCVNVPIFGIGLEPTPTKKVYHLLSLASDRYEFYHRFCPAKASPSLEQLQTAKIWFLNKKHTHHNISYYIDVLRSLKIPFPVYDTPYSIGIAIFDIENSPFQKEIYITGFEKAFIVDSWVLDGIDKTDAYTVNKTGTAEEFLQLVDVYDNHIYEGFYPLSDIGYIGVQNSVGRVIKPYAQGFGVLYKEN